jgi:hypothetical protein
MPDNIITNVIEFPKKNVAIFNQRQRERLVTSIKDLTPTPEVAVERIEQDLCAQIVETVREGASLVGEKVAQRLAKLLFK